MAVEQGAVGKIIIDPRTFGPDRTSNDHGGTREFFTRLVRTRLAGIGLMIVVLFTAIAILTPVIAPYSPTKQKITNALKPPSLENLLGTDELGRDILSRVMYGGQVSLKVGLVSVGLALLVGVFLGLLAGYWSNSLFEQVTMRIMDALLAFPQLVLAIALVAAFGVDKEDTVFPKVILAIAIVGIPAIAANAVNLCCEARICGSRRAVGARDHRIILRHIFPNITAPLIVQSSLGIAGAMLAEAGLSFLGLGVQPPTPSWGSMLSAGRGYLEIDPWLLIGPGAAVFLAVLGFNFLGDGIRDVLDPRLRNT
jgi:peptide/nickel transport system permease protein